MANKSPYELLLQSLPAAERERVLRAALEYQIPTDDPSFIIPLCMTRGVFAMESILRKLEGMQGKVQPSVSAIDAIKVDLTAHVAVCCIGALTFAGIGFLAGIWFAH